MIDLTYHFLYPPSLCATGGPRRRRTKRKRFRPQKNKTTTQNTANKQRQVREDKYTKYLTQGFVLVEDPVARAKQDKKKKKKRSNSPSGQTRVRRYAGSKKYLGKTTRRQESKPKRKPQNVVTSKAKAIRKAKKLNQTRQRYGKEVLRRYAYRLTIPDPPKKLRKEIGGMRPVEWAQTFYNWEQVYNHYLTRRDAGEPFKSVQPCIIALRLPESHLKEVIHSFKVQIARALALGKQMPGVPGVLKDEVKGETPEKWFKSCADHKNYLKNVKKSSRQPSANKTKY